MALFSLLDGQAKKGGGNGRVGLAGQGPAYDRVTAEASGCMSVPGARTGDALAGVLACLVGFHEVERSRVGGKHRAPRLGPVPPRLHSWAARCRRRSGDPKFRSPGDSVAPLSLSVFWRPNFSSDRATRGFSHPRLGDEGFAYLAISRSTHPPSKCLIRRSTITAAKRQAEVNQSAHVLTLPTLVLRRGGLKAPSTPQKRNTAVASSTIVKARPAHLIGVLRRSGLFTGRGPKLAMYVRPEWGLE